MYANSIPSTGRADYALRVHRYLPEWHDDIVDDFNDHLKREIYARNDEFVCLFTQRNVRSHIIRPLLRYISIVLADKLCNSHYFNVLLRETITYNHSDDQLVVHHRGKIPSADPQRVLWCQLFVVALDEILTEQIVAVLSAGQHPTATMPADQRPTASSDGIGAPTQDRAPPTQDRAPPTQDRAPPTQEEPHLPRTEPHLPRTEPHYLLSTSSYLSLLSPSAFSSVSSSLSIVR